MILAFLWNLLSKSINTKQFFDIIEFSLRRQSRLLRIDCSLNINGHDFRQMNTFPSFVIKWSLKVFRSNIRGTPHRYLEPTQTRNDHLIALYAHGIDKLVYSKEKASRFVLQSYMYDGKLFDKSWVENWERSKASPTVSFCAVPDMT